MGATPSRIRRSLLPVAGLAAVAYHLRLWCKTGMWTRPRRRLW